MLFRDHSREPSQKRLACDRCHTRKLRCFRDVHSRQCSRCIQDGCDCTYSSPLKPGRPRKTPRVPTADDVVNHQNNSNNSANNVDNLLAQNIDFNLDVNSQPTDQEWQSLLNFDENLLIPSSDVSDSDPRNANLQSPSSCQVHDFMGQELDLGPGDADVVAGMHISPELDSLYSNNGVAPAAGLLPTTMPSICSFTPPKSPSRNVQNQVPSPLSPFHSASSSSSSSSLKQCPNDSQSHLNSKDKGSNGGNMTCNSSSNTNGSSSSHSISEMIHRLSRLQQDLLQLANPCFRGSDSSGTTTTTRTVTIHEGDHRREGKRQSFCPSPINAILKPGQELIDIIRLLLSRCQQNDNECTQSWQPSDQQILLPFTLTPISLLLSIYGQLVREIAVDLNKCRLDSNDRCDISNGSGTGTPLSTTGLAPSIRSNYLQQQQLDSQRPRVHSTLIPDNSSLTLGDLSLDRPLQLILLARVVNHHLVYLEQALHLYQNSHTQNSPPQGVPERLFPTILAEMKSSVRILVSEIRFLL